MDPATHNSRCLLLQFLCLALTIWRSPRLLPQGSFRTQSAIVSSPPNPPIHPSHAGRKSTDSSPFMQGIIISLVIVHDGCYGGRERERAVLKSHQLFGVCRNVTEGSSTTPQRQMVSRCLCNQPLNSKQMMDRPIEELSNYRDPSCNESLVNNGNNTTAPQETLSVLLLLRDRRDS